MRRNTLSADKNRLEASNVRRTGKTRYTLHFKSACGIYLFLIVVVYFMTSCTAMLWWWKRDIVDECQCGVRPAQHYQAQTDGNAQWRRRWRVRPPALKLHSAYVSALRLAPCLAERVSQCILIFELIAQKYINYNNWKEFVYVWVRAVQICNSNFRSRQASTMPWPRQATTIWWAHSRKCGINICTTAQL